MIRLESLALKLHERSLSILDQTRLPNEENWEIIRDPEQMVQAIHELRVRGAPLIGVAAALTLGLFAQESSADWQGFLQKAESLRRARPTAVNLMWAIDRMKSIGDSAGWRDRAMALAVEIFEEDQRLCRLIAENGVAQFQDGDQILTHCNTGGLATVGVGTALGVIRLAHEQGKRIHVFVDETRPLLQGGRLTTYELQRLGIPYTLICDNMAASLMAKGRITKAIVGADRIAANGDFANKVGTYSVAVACHYHQIPFYTAAPYSTLDLKCRSGRDIPVEERAAYEVQGVRGSFGKVRWSPESAPVYNPSFDVTPASLVTGWILDRGYFDRKQVQGRALEGLKL